MKKVPKNLFQFLALCILASLAIGVWSALSLRSTLQTPNDQSNTSQAAVADLVQLQLAMQTLVASARGYLLTGDPQLKQQSTDATTDVTAGLARLSARPRKAGTFDQELAVLAELWAAYQPVLERAFALRDGGASPAAIVSHVKVSVLPRTQELQRVLSVLSSEVSTLHAEDVKRTQAINFRFVSFILTGTLASLAFLLWAYLINVRRFSDLNQLTDETRGLLDTFFQYCPIGLTLIDRDFRYLRVNETLAETHGKTPQEHIGRTIEEVAPGVWDQIKGDLERVVLHGESVSREKVVEYPKGSGQFRYWMAGYFPVRDGQGTIKGVGNFATEITERRRLVENLKQSNAELERFAYVASHDLREPLRMISTYLGLLQRELAVKLTESESSHLAFALDGAKRLNAMVGSLLHFSRIGREKVDLQPVDLNKVLQEVLANLQTAVEESGAYVDIQALPTVVADRLQAVQLLQNLVSNALKFRKPQTKPSVHISARTQGDFCVVAVKDDGLGIPEMDQKSIFEIFRRLHRRTEYPGDGIGLAACKKIVEMHGGKIWVESQDGKGATFHFTLPLKPSPV